MSPAGHWPQLTAAIEAGADAVYFGLNQFSARAKVGFEASELPEVMTQLHQRGVKGFLTFNTLVFDTELHAAERAIIAAAEAGVDALIVQDIGATQIARRIAPQLDLHGSTQMSVTSAQGAELCQQLGCSRVVLGRELSLKDIERVAADSPIELEVFVHGALCVSYSGQCFSSEAWGGRSANRGQCAQACRLSYELLVNGQHRETGANRYLLSPGDLYAVEQVPQLIRLGISCLKIEGRYKDENYVSLTTQAYRQAVDRAFAELTPSAVPTSSDSISKKQLEQIYSRGLDAHFMQGTNHQTVVNGRAPRHRGLLVGEVVDLGFDLVVVAPCEEIKPGDGLVFDAADWRSPDQPEEGGNVYHVQSYPNGEVRLAFAESAIDFQRVRVGDRVWRTKDPKLLVQLKPLAKPKATIFTQPIDLSVSGQVGAPLTVNARLGNGISIQAKSSQHLSTALKRALDHATLSEQLGRLGGTPFRLGELSLQLDGELFLPVSQLNALRRELVERLLAARSKKAITIESGQVDRWFERQAKPTTVATWIVTTTESTTATLLPTPIIPKTPRFHVLVRTPEQLAAAIECRPSTITLDYLELYGLRPSVESILNSGIEARVASPRILKPVEQKVVRFLLSLHCPILVRSGGMLVDLLKEDESTRPRLIGDFSLNAANVISAQHYLDLGLNTLTPPYDLNGDQVTALTEWIDPSRLEVITYSHLPVFHMEHCVFCRFLSSGTDNTNCGHPCETHRVELKDHRGRVHPVMADVGCRNTVFGGEAQFSVKGLAKWREHGLADFRIEFVHETAEQVIEVINAFHAWENQPARLSELSQSLARTSPSGTTEGSLFVPLQSN